MRFLLALVSCLFSGCMVAKSGDDVFASVWTNYGVIESEGVQGQGSVNPIGSLASTTNKSRRVDGIETASQFRAEFPSGMVISGPIQQGTSRDPIDGIKTVTLIKSAAKVFGKLIDGAVDAFRISER